MLFLDLFGLDQDLTSIWHTIHSSSSDILVSGKALFGCWETGMTMTAGKAGERDWKMNRYKMNGRLQELNLRLFSLTTICNSCDGCRADPSWTERELNRAIIIRSRPATDTEEVAQRHLQHDDRQPRWFSFFLLSFSSWTSSHSCSF